MLRAFSLLGLPVFFRKSFDPWARRRNVAQCLLVCSVSLRDKRFAEDAHHRLRSGALAHL